MKTYITVQINWVWAPTKRVVQWISVLHTEDKDNNHRNV